MTEAEKIRRKLEMINRNSTYGLACQDLAMIWCVNSGEIAKMIHDYVEGDIGKYGMKTWSKTHVHIRPVKIKTLKERLEEEATMHEDCYFCIKRDICTRDVPKPCTYRYTEECRIADQAADRFGAILHGTYLPNEYKKKKEDNVADTDDDIFNFVFEGDNILQSCKAAGLFAVREKDQKIKELEIDNEKLKREYEKELIDLQSKYERAFIGKQMIKEEYEELFKEFFKLIKEEKKDE